jgi:hypothetical protein
VSEILEDWQASIDGLADVPLEEFLAGERVFNLTDVPIGGHGCDPQEATTIATDRASLLEAGTAVAALAKGIILADVAEMHLFGPGLDPDAPIAKDVGVAAPDIDALAAGTPSADASCAEWADHVIVGLQAGIDAASTYGATLVFIEPGDAPLIPESQAVVDDALAGAEATCGRPDVLLELAGRWDQLHATGLAGNVWLGGITDNYYDEFSELSEDD